MAGATTKVGRVAVVDTDLFQWEIVPGEPDKRLVFSNVLLLAHNYLRHGYDLVLRPHTDPGGGGGDGGAARLRWPAGSIVRMLGGRTPSAP